MTLDRPHSNGPLDLMTREAIHRPPEDWLRVVRAIDNPTTRRHVACIAWWDLVRYRRDIAILQPLVAEYQRAERDHILSGLEEVPADLGAIRAALVSVGYHAGRVADRVKQAWSYSDYGRRREWKEGGE